MKNSLFFLLLSIPFFSFGNKIDFFEGSVEAAFQKAADEDKLIFVDFYAHWCRPCKDLEKHSFKNKELSEYLNANFINLKVDVDQANPFFKSFMKDNIKSIPYLAFFSSGKEHLGAIKGFVEAYVIYDYANTVKKDFVAIKKISPSEMDQKAESIALELCEDLKTFTSVALQLNESKEGTAEFKSLEIQLEAEMEKASQILQALDEKFGVLLNSQYFIDQFGKELEENCQDTFMVMQFLVE